MNIPTEITSAVERVSKTKKDFLAVESERLKVAAFGEHIEACLDALYVTNDGIFDENIYLEVITTDRESNPVSRITFAGLGKDYDDDEESENLKLVVSVNDLKRPEGSPAFLLIEYTPTEEGNKFNG